MKEQTERVFSGDAAARDEITKRVQNVPKIMLVSPDHPFGNFAEMYRRSGFDEEKLLERVRRYIRKI